MKIAAVMVLLFTSSFLTSNGLASDVLTVPGNVIHSQDPSPPESSQAETTQAETEKTASGSQSDAATPEPLDEEAAEATRKQAERAAKLQAARLASPNAPQQPFFNHWLWLIAIALLLVTLTYVPARPRTTLGDEASTRPILDAIQRFAFRFTALYFTLFFLPLPIAYIPWVGSWLTGFYTTGASAVVAWVAENVLRISSDFVPYSGSGDSTESFVKLFSLFSIAMTSALIWSLIDRRKSDYRILRDLFHSNITYVLALTMLGYGLMKIGYARNQFSITSGSTLESTWGDSSPMGVLWKFMGSSRPYTIFAGMGETAGALLLIFRRTRTLGALAIFGVLANVVMLNFCYDVPVKINSSHLVLLALCLAMRDVDRLVNILFFNRATNPVDQKPPYTGPKTIWLQRALKAAAVIMWFGMPIYSHITSEIEYANRPAEPEYFGSLSVKEHRVGDQVLSSEADETWQRVAFSRFGVNLKMEPVPSYWLRIKTNGGEFKQLTFELEGDNRLVVSDSKGATFKVPPELKITKTDKGDWLMKGASPEGLFEITLKGSDDASTTLMGRGFRWVNEVPFNR